MMAKKVCTSTVHLCKRLNRNYLYSPSTLFSIFPAQVRQLMIETISSCPLPKYNILLWVPTFMVFYRFDNLVKKSLW